MQQVQSVGFRLGSTVGWNTSNFYRIEPEISSQMTDSLRRLCALRGAFLINNYFYQHRGVTFCVLTYYQYFQRSRLKRWIVRSLRKREGALSPPNVRNYAMIRLGLLSRKSWVERRRGLKKIFPKGGLKGYSPLAKKSRKVRGWIDLEYRILRTFWVWKANTFNDTMRKETSRLFPRAEFRAHNLLEFMPGSNPLMATKHYIFKRFSGMLYQHDLVESIFVATQINSSALMAHSITVGLERHARQRQQMRYLKTIRSIIEHMLMWKEIDNKLIWRILISGKLDAKMRRTTFGLRVGFIRYQKVDFVTSYTVDEARTRFGTTSVRVWMRNLLTKN